jgi:hypothetical protein
MVGIPLFPYISYSYILQSYESKEPALKFWTHCMLACNFNELSQMFHVF